MANTISVIEKPIPDEVSEKAYVLGVQPDANGLQALYRLPLGSVRANDTNDLFIVPILIEKYGAKAAFKMFIEANAQSKDSSLADIADRFYRAAAKTIDATYTTEFYKYTTSNSPVGTKLDDNATLTCTPSTIASPGTDDYADLTLFMTHDVNYTIDPDTLEPVIHAIKDVYGEFSYTPEDSFVGVMQMTGWVRRTSTETTKKVEYRAQKTEGFEPLPEAVRASDNSVRAFVIHAKYAAGYNTAGKLSSISGVQPATLRTGSAGSTSISHDGQIAKWREWGNQYCGSSLCDNAFLQLMLEIKYASLGSVSVMSGCRSYSTSYTAAVSENDVRRIILTPAQAAFFVVVSRVSLGTETDRSKATCYDVCDITTIESIEDVTIEGTAYKAINLAAENAFNTVADVTNIIPQPWLTGATDDVPGNDGSPYNNTSGKEPFKLQGIEVMLGMYEVAADITLYEDAVNGYTVYANRKAAEIASGNAGTNPVTLGTIPKEETAAWKYNAELNWDENSQEKYMIPTLFDGGTTTGYRSATYRDAQSTIGWRQWLAFGYLYVAGVSGLACAALSLGLGYGYWFIGARASGTGGNRGEYTAA